MSFKPKQQPAGALQLMRSTDGGTTFNAVPTVDQCNFVAFGKGNSAVTPFGLHSHGRANGDSDDAIYKSEDLGQSWTRVSEPRMNQFGTITTLAGDIANAGSGLCGAWLSRHPYGYGPKSGLSGSDRQPVERPEHCESTERRDRARRNADRHDEPACDIACANQPLGCKRHHRDGLNSMQILFDGQPAPIVATVAGEAIVTAPYGLQDRIALRSNCTIGPIP